MNIDKADKVQDLVISQIVALSAKPAAPKPAAAAAVPEGATAAKPEATGAVPTLR